MYERRGRRCRLTTGDDFLLDGFGDVVDPGHGDLPPGVRTSDLLRILA